MKVTKSMKKILVLSDSHGEIKNMLYAVKKTRPDMIIHLGDCASDANRLRELVPDIDIVNVPGNCDFSDEEAEQILSIEGFRILICHGHTYAVKMSYLSLECGALEKEVDLVMFGHTHRVFYDNHNGLYMFNPGSIGSPGYGAPASYGIVTLDGENESIDLDISYFE